MIHSPRDTVISRMNHGVNKTIKINSIINNNLLVNFIYK